MGGKSGGKTRQAGTKERSGKNQAPKPRRRQPPATLTRPRRTLADVEEATADATVEPPPPAAPAPPAPVTSIHPIERIETVPDVESLADLIERIRRQE